MLSWGEEIHTFASVHVAQGPPDHRWGSDLGGLEPVLPILDAPDGDEPIEFSKVSGVVSVSRRSLEKDTVCVWPSARMRRRPHSGFISVKSASLREPPTSSMRHGSAAPAPREGDVEHGKGGRGHSQRNVWMTGNGVSEGGGRCMHSKKFPGRANRKSPAFVRPARPSMSRAEP